VKPTIEDFKPRRDGLFEHEGTWAEVSVGTLLAQRDSRKGVWEVVATSHGTGQIEYGKTLWMRVRNVSTGEEHTLPPHTKTGTVVILTKSPLDTEPIPHTEPTDTEAIMLLVDQLGATLLASRDEETGQIACPDYVWKTHLEKGEPHPFRRGLIDHMRFAHAMSADDDLSYENAIILHGQAHRPEWPNIGKGGFVHIHLPEEDVQNDWVRNRKARGIHYGAPSAQEAS
jgi:hypothetical protein